VIWLGTIRPGADFVWVEYWNRRTEMLVNFW
jgi:hypothetical protein